VLRKGGLKEENIIVFMYDDIANNEENPRPGVIINSPHGDDVYKGVPKVFLIIFCFFFVSLSNVLFPIQASMYPLYGLFYGRIILAMMLMLTTSSLLYLEISQLLLVAVERLWIVVLMITYLYTIVTMVVLECWVSDYYQVRFILCLSFCLIMTLFSRIKQLKFLPSSMNCNIFSSNLSL
jgi:hypothetical protein